MKYGVRITDFVSWKQVEVNYFQADKQAKWAIDFMVEHGDKALQMGKTCYELTINGK
jgi:hypothetical protein